MKITRKAFRSLVREVLLAEAAMTPEAATKLGMRFDISKAADGVTIRVYSNEEEDPIGILEVHPTDYPAEGAWAVYFSEAHINGLGPLMYDLMMDVIHPHPLMSDRSTVSADAKRVWDYYHNYRHDVEEIQLDDPENTLTADDNDNAEQWSAMNWNSNAWPESSLSKAYRKSSGVGQTLRALKSLGILSMQHYQSPPRPKNRRSDHF